MKSQLEEIEQLQSLGARFLSLWVEPSPNAGEVSLIYYFRLLDGSIRTISRLSRAGATPSIYSYFGCADWAERDVARRYGLRFTGNPNASKPALVVDSENSN